MRRQTLFPPAIGLPFRAVGGTVKDFMTGSGFRSLSRRNRPPRPLLRLSLLSLLALTLPAINGVAQETVNVTATDVSQSQGLTPDQRSRETPIVLAVRRATPSVVNLHGQKTVRASATGMVGGAQGGFRQVNGMGTGVIIDPRGYIITNYHVVEDVDDIRVTLHDGTVTSAKLIASRPRNDLALVKINFNQKLAVAPRGTSSDLMAGETVIAIGNAYGYVHTCTTGVISALHRDIPVNETQDYRDLIQISAGINPGNSGGPLLNINGDMIGINVAVRVGAQQIAFAIPIDQVIDIVTSMIDQYNENRIATGMRIDGGPRDGDGATITHVAASSPAATQGLKPGDRVVRIDSIPVDDPLDAGLALLEVRSGAQVNVQVQRNQQQLTVALRPKTSTGSSLTHPAHDAAWSIVGIRAKPVSPSIMQRMNQRMGTPYPGGLYITSVRQGSVAAQEGLRNGDILLGIYGWQTTSLEDLLGILDHPDIRKGPKARFYIVRREQTLYGDFKLAARPGSRVH